MMIFFVRGNNKAQSREIQKTKWNLTILFKKKEKKDKQNEDKLIKNGV